MNFKDEYTEMQNDIKPRADFLEDLARKMDAAEQTRQKKTSAKPRIIFVSAAATTAAAAAVLVVLFSVKKPAPVPIKNTANYKFSYTVGLFAESDVFSGDCSIPEQLSQMLIEDSAVVYKSDENVFDGNDKLTEEQRKELSEKVRSARETDLKPGKKADYYMVVTDGGDIVKFRIADNVLAAGEKFYEIL